MTTKFIQPTYQEIKGEPVNSTSFQAIEKTLNATFFERQDEVRGLLVTAIARGNVLLLGGKGSAKTALVEALASQIEGSQLFHRLYNRMSTMEDVFGSLSLKELENDNYIRNVAGKLPTAHFAVLDEIFKSNMALLNSHLSILNERVYFNDGGSPIEIPLMGAVGCSNELPEGGVTGELAPLYDRFELRYMVDYIAEEKNFISMLELASIKPALSITLGQLKQAQIEAQLVSVPASFIRGTLVTLWKKLKVDGYSISDRKFRNSLRYLKANAWLEGRQEVNEDDIEIFCHLLWDEPEQIKPIRKIVLSLGNPLTVKANEIYDACAELANIVKVEPEGATRSAKATEANHKLKLAQNQLKNAIMQANGVGTSKAEARLLEIKKMNEEIVSVLLGL